MFQAWSTQTLFTKMFIRESSGRARLIGLPTKIVENAVCAFPQKNLGNAFGGKWVEIETVRCVKVGADCLWLLFD